MSRRNIWHQEGRHRRSLLKHFDCIWLAEGNEVVCEEHDVRLYRGGLPQTDEQRERVEDVLERVYGR